MTTVIMGMAWRRLCDSMLGGKASGSTATWMTFTIRRLSMDWRLVFLAQTTSF